MFSLCVEDKTRQVQEVPPYVKIVQPVSRKYLRSSMIWIWILVIIYKKVQLVPIRQGFQKQYATHNQKPTTQVKPIFLLNTFLIMTFIREKE